jgi:hypothetical protein
MNSIYMQKFYEVDPTTSPTRDSPRIIGPVLTFGPLAILRLAPCQPFVHSAGIPSFIQSQL